MLTEWPLLSLLIWFPIFGGIIVLWAGESSRQAVRKLTLAIAIIEFLFSLLLFIGFDNTTASFQFVERHGWINNLGIYYHLGIDGIALPLILLTTFTTVFVVISAWDVIKEKVSQYMASFLIMTGLTVGIFAALDAILFYVFFEAVLIPMFIVIGIWGGPRRVYASIKFFLYTFLGSIFMLVGLIYMYRQAGSFYIPDLHDLPMGLNVQVWIFIAFLLAFGVKIPMFPVHTWLPDAHVEAPTGGSVVLAAVMLKVGGYGLLRFALPITPDAVAHLDWFVILLSLIAVVYIGFVALVQTDMKKLIAYSSISHMGFVTLGFFIVFAIFQRTGATDGAVMAIEGGMVQMISHGFISGAMFLCIGVLYDRLHTRDISAYGGVINTMPIFAAFAIFFSMANAGLPGTSGFVGEFLVILASFKANFWIAFFAAITLILGASYTLWMVKRVLLGDVANDNVAGLKDINSREFFMLAGLAIFVLGLGLWPAPLLDMMRPSIVELVQHIAASKL